MLRLAAGSWWVLGCECFELGGASVSLLGSCLWQTVPLHTYLTRSIAALSLPVSAVGANCWLCAPSLTPLLNPHHPHHPTGKALQQLVVRPETALIRPYVVAAVLRGVTLDASRYNSFIDLQV